MGRIEDYVEAVTRRLRADPELHMDISNEIRTHLEDAVEEARARGLSDKEALDAAIKAFGDETEIADAIWRANRSRMRLRALIKWIVRLTLVPAAFLFTLYLCNIHLLLWGILTRPRTDIFKIAYEAKARRDLTDEEKFIYEHLSYSEPEVKKIMEGFPGNRQYYGYYTVIYLNHISVKYKKVSPVNEMSQEDFEQAVNILERGKRTDPQNAFYNYMKAALLMGRSSTLDRDTDELEIHNRGLFEQAIEEVRRGAIKPYCKSYVKEVMELREQLMEKPENLPQLLTLTSINASVPLQTLAHMRMMVRRSVRYAGILVAEGRKEEALRLLESARRPGIQFGADASFLIEILLARACLAIVEKGTLETYEKLGMSDEAAEVTKAIEAGKKMWDFYKAPYAAPEDKTRRKYYGALANILLPSYRKEPDWVSDSRIAEHKNLQRLMLMILTLTLSLILLVFLILTLLNFWRFRKSPCRPKLLFIGWKRIGIITLFCLVLPLALYWIYTHILPFSSMGYGFTYCPGRVTLELALLYVFIIGSVFAMSYRTIRERCLDAGMQAPPAGVFNPLRKKWSLICSLFLLAAIIGYFLFWEKEFLRSTGGFIGAGAIILIALAYFIWQFVRIRGREVEKRHFRGSFIRSVIPILAAYLLAAGVISNAYLTLSEAKLIRHINEPGQRLFLDELEMSSFNLYREHLQELNRQWNKKHGIGERPEIKSGD